MKWGKLADRARVRRTMEALRGRGIYAEFLEKKEAAFERLTEIIPDGAEIMTGGSTTLDEIGFVDFLKSGKHKWKNLKDKILSEKDPIKQGELRRKSVTAEYYIGSVHAVTQSGEIMIASATGSQLPAYAFSSDNVIWVVGTQKIVPNLEDGLRRVREYCLPLEDKRMKSLGYSGSTLGKILIFERETLPNRKVTLIFVNEKLGF